MREGVIENGSVRSFDDGRAVTIIEFPVRQGAGLIPGVLALCHYTAGYPLFGFSFRVQRPQVSRR
jgi:hypothetical protein